MNHNNLTTIARWWGRVWGIMALIGLFILPSSARADNTYFCSTAISEGGSGSATAPWACADDTQLEAVLNTVCTNGGGTLYRSLDESFVTYEVQPTENAGCTVQSQINPGQPPTAGGSAPLPLLLVGAGLIGALVLAAGLVLRRRPVHP